MIAAGTRIATTDGDVPAERLRAGDRVLAIEDGETVARPLRWVGRAEVDLARHPSPARAAPVRILADALAPGRPLRDLSLSPDHALLIDGGLFQAQALRNGATVSQPVSTEKITYIHLELARHGVLLAEGAAVESYLDVGNRMQFAAGRAARGLAPDLAAAPSAATWAVWKARACAPLRLDTADIRPMHMALAVRAGTMRWTITADPALAVVADDEPVPLARFSAELAQARLPAGIRAVRLRSRTFAPCDFDPAISDRRRLGLAVRGLRLHGRPLPPSVFGRGWHLSEPDWRWTDGDARLAFRALAQPETLEIRTAPGAAPGYWAPPP